MTLMSQLAVGWPLTTPSTSLPPTPMPVYDCQLGTEPFSQLTLTTVIWAVSERACVCSSSTTQAYSLLSALCCQASDSDLSGTVPCVTSILRRSILALEVILQPMDDLFSLILVTTSAIFLQRLSKYVENIR